MWNTIEQMAPYAVGYTVPILITALGGLFSERSGIINIGLEGLMVIGSFVGGVSVYYFGPLMGNARAAWLGILLAMLAGTLFRCCTPSRASTSTPTRRSAERPST